MKIYEISRCSGKVECEVVDGKKRYPLRHVVYHSPDGFEMGYPGSGPADLALSILADHFGDEKWAWSWHQHFKEAFIAPVKGDVCVITEVEIDAWNETVKKGK